MSLICPFEMMPCQTGMYGFCGSDDEPSPCSMMSVICATVNVFPTSVSAGTSGETSPAPWSPWHWSHAKRTKS